VIDTEAAQWARVAFATAVAGIDVAGTAHRMDGVPVPLRALLGGDRATAEDVLAAIAERL
jgi:formylmethanofuran dehydrogenase subunit B